MTGGDIPQTITLTCLWIRTRAIQISKEGVLVAVWDVISCMLQW